MAATAVLYNPAMSKKSLDDAVLDTLERLADVSQKNTEAVKGIITLLKSQARRITALEAAAKQKRSTKKK